MNDRYRQQDQDQLSVDEIREGIRKTLSDAIGNPGDTLTNMVCRELAAIRVERRDGESGPDTSKRMAELMRPVIAAVSGESEEKSRDYAAISTKALVEALVRFNSRIMHTCILGSLNMIALLMKLHKEGKLDIANSPMAVTLMEIIGTDSFDEAASVIGDDGAKAFAIAMTMAGYLTESANIMARTKFAAEASGASIARVFRETVGRGPGGGGPEIDLPPGSIPPSI